MCRTGRKRLPFVLRCLAIQARKRIGSLIRKLCTIGRSPKVQHQKPLFRRPSVALATGGLDRSMGCQ